MWTTVKWSNNQWSNIICVKLTGEDHNLKKIRINEKQIFGKNKINKESEYDRFIKGADNTIKAIFDPGTNPNELKMMRNQNNQAAMYIIQIILLRFVLS